MIHALTTDRLFTTMALGLALFAGCAPAKTSPSFRNVGTGTTYVGDEACLDCHEEEYLGFSRHAMSRSFSLASAVPLPQSSVDTTLFHPGTRLSYRVYSKGDTLYQEELVPTGQSPEGKRLRRRADFVVGSGNVARTYLTEANGRLFELPITWYSQSSRWDFSPGYLSRNARFDRQIPDRCISCHNSYPVTTGTIDGKYVSLPSGIGCERCHGPGDLHVRERLEIPDPPGDFDDTIVNPSRLDLERRLDVCSQCHLHTTTSVLRRGRHAFDFVPSEVLSDHVALFYTPATRLPDASSVTVVSHGDRMKRSACFNATAARSEPMECVTCHDPHRTFRQEGPEYFNRTCRGCHPVAVLATRVRADKASDHTESSACVSCHMPRVEVEDAPHTSFTDHWIRVADAHDTDVAASSGDALIPYFSRDRDNREGQAYLGMALIAYGRQTADAALMAAGTATLEVGLRGTTPWSEGQFLLGVAYIDLGRIDLSVGPLEAAVREDQDPRYLDALARAYAVNGRARDAKSFLRQALQVEPAYVEARYHYAELLQQTGALDSAIVQYRLAIAEQPWHTASRLMLGTALLSSDVEAARRTFQGAAALDPELRDALAHIVVLRDSRDSAEWFDGLATDRPSPRRSSTYFSPSRAGAGNVSPPGIAFTAGTSVQRIRLFSAQGDRVRDLETNSRPTVVWDLRDSRGRTVPTGLYLVRLTPGEEELRQLILVRLP